MFKTLALSLILAAGTLSAGVVTMTDGTSISGQVKEQADGSVIVVTGAGEVSVAKDKIRSILQDSTQAVASEEDTPYVKAAKERRAKYGNEDGGPRTQNLQANQLLFTIGTLNYLGDAFVIQDPTSGATLLSASDLAGPSFGLAWAHSYTDYVALELWGDYSGIAKEYTISNVRRQFVQQRFDLGVGVKVQKALALGGPEQSISFIPSLGITPFWGQANGSTLSSTGVGDRSYASSSLGASANVGLDLQFGGALIALKLRYLMATDLSPSLKSSNTSAWMPQIGAGFAF